MKILTTAIAVITALTSVVISGCDTRSAADEYIDFVDFAHAADYSTHSQNEDSIWVIVNRHKDTFGTMCEMLGLPQNSNLEDWIELPAIKGFAQAVADHAPSEERIRKDLIYIQDAAHKEALELPVRKYAGVIWGKPHSIMFADSTIFISLNHYLGSDHPAYASLPFYRLIEKKQESLPYDVVEALLATQYPFEHTDSSAVINRLVYEGVLIEAKMRLVKDASLADALGYTEKQLAWFDENESMIWRKINASKLLFDHSDDVVCRMVSPAPFTAPISAETPGRAGRYIGYKIVRSYIDKHNDVELKYLFSRDFYGVMNPLVNSGYNPL